VPARNVILSGGIFHPFEKTSAELAALLAPLGIESEVHEHPDAAAAALDDADLLTVNALRWRMYGEKYDPHRAEWAYSPSDATRDRLVDFVRSGGGLLGIHTASICFDDWPGWGALLGGAWVWGTSHHPPPGPFGVVPTASPHPITRGLGGFELEDEVYSALALRPEVAPLLASDAATGAQPLLWACERGRGRVVYDALGHDERSFAHETHRRLLRRAALWALGRDDAEVEAA
jgi:type 1 glutamine amidotransferase